MSQNLSIKIPRYVSAVLTDISSAGFRKTRRLALAAGIFVVTLGYTQAVLAFITDPELEPNPAIAGQAVNVLLTTGICHGVLGGENNPAITINGQSIDVLIDGIREFDPTWCFFPAVDHVFPIDDLPPGDYIVTVRFRYTPFGLPTEIEVLGELPLTVVQGQVALSVPTIGAMGSFITVIIVFLMGVLAARRQDDSAEASL